MAPHRRIADGVWRQASRGDTAHLDHEHILSVIGDLRHCYEQVRHEGLEDAAMSFDYPLRGLQYAAATYTWPRVLALAGQASPKIYPWQGIVAGSSTATFEIKCHMLPVVSNYPGQELGP
eukprot:919768-Pyramimonas_sp.AAC.1